MTDLRTALATADAAIADARRAPLSRRKAMLAALQLDAVLDSAFATSGEGDILVFRAACAAGSADLALLLDLGAMRRDGPYLEVRQVEVPLQDYADLSVEDFMVSLYNGHTVQRILVVSPDGGTRDIHDLLDAARTAIAALA